MWMGDDKKIINYEWPYTKLLYKVYKRLQGIVPISPALSLFLRLFFMLELCLFCGNCISI